MTFTFTFPLAHGIRCYKCLGTEDYCAKDKLEADKKKNVMECPEVFDRCLRKWIKKDDKTAVMNACATQNTCDVEKKACDEISGDCAVGCCESDECNAGSTVTFSAVLITMCSVLGPALMG